MRVAIIGGGFAGLGLAYFLLESKAAQVTIFEKGYIGAGASGVASGLLHPYAGFAARRSQKAKEALATAKQLLLVAEKHTPKIVATQAGILRSSMEDAQHERLIMHAEEHGDVEHLQDNLFLIHSGITVSSENYLEGLSSAVTKMGGEFVFQKITDLEELSSFDQIVIAAGYGIKEFPECAHLRVRFLKGQALRMNGKPPKEKSYISKGYIANLGSETRFEIGSTYERTFIDTNPDLEVAKGLLAHKLSLCPHAKILDCRAAVRVCSEGHYAPIIEPIGKNIHVFTGLGSRGLLYHGLYGRILAHRLLSKNKILS